MFEKPWEKRSDPTFLKYSKIVRTIILINSEESSMSNECKMLPPKYSTIKSQEK